MTKQYSRREMLKLTGLTGVGLLATACVPQGSAPSSAADSAAEGESEAAAMEVTIIWDTFRGVGTGWNEERMDTFREMHPNVTIEFRPLTGSSQQDNYGKMYALHAAGDLGDVIAFDPSHYHFWRAINKNIIGPIDDLVSADGLDLGEWYDTFMSLQYFQGEQYGLPSWGWAGFDTLVTNAVHFEEAGIELPDVDSHDTSMDTIAEWAHTFRDEDAGRYGLARSNSEAGLVTLTRAFGGFLINEDGTKCMILEDEGSRAALQWAYKLAVEDNVLPSPDDIGGSFPSAQLANKLTMNWGGSLNVRNFDRDIEDESQARAWQILLPTREDGRFPSQIRGGTWNILKDTEHPEESFQFLKHIAGKDGSFGFNKVGGNFAAVRPDVVALLIEDNPIHEWFISSLENGIPAHAPANSRGREYTDAVAQWSSLLFDPNQPVEFEQGLQDLHDNIQKVLDQPPA